MQLTANCADTTVTLDYVSYPSSCEQTEYYDYTGTTVNHCCAEFQIQALEKRNLNTKSYFVLQTQLHRCILYLNLKYFLNVFCI